MQNMSHSMSDPASKAVVDNVMEKLPSKMSQVRCHDCDLEFTSSVVLDAHLQGARHARVVINNKQYFLIMPL